ncbi:hypothetical protein OG436_29490 [Streptomyces caniferus]|uniref:hypothetical protein n=1 Tax=Streptomyces caniferus TaxID=285557 RepID=UPI002E281108|nr:hypothetical protein [Streptomyces caniferus]
MSFRHVAEHARTVYYDGDQDMACKVLNGYAHELSQRIRDEIQDPNPLASLFEPFAGTLAADLIDPDKGES